jgi:hypothetical protein
MLCKCSGGTDPLKAHYSDYIIKVDKVIVKEDSISSKAITLIFEGFASINGCYSFKEFEVSSYENEIDIIVWGQKVENVGCPEAEEQLNSKELIINVSDPGLYFIRIHQPDDSIILKNVYVK